MVSEREFENPLLSTTVETQTNRILWKRIDKKMDRNVTSSLPVEKLDRSNYAFWSYKMHHYLLGHNYWS